MEVVKLPIAELQADPRNARSHDARSIDALVDSLRRFGQQKPIVVGSDNVVVAGNGLLAAAQRLGWTDIDAVRTTLGGAAVTAYGIVDNRSAELSSWDSGVLSELVDELRSEGGDIAALGFAEGELAALLGTSSVVHGDPEATPEIPTIVTSRVGDVWLCNAHRVVCGDCTDADVVTAVLGHLQPHLMVTDPLYAVSYDPDWRNRADRKNGKPYGARAVGRVENYDRADWADAYSLFPGDVAYVWHPAGARQVEFYASLVAAGFDVRMQIIWAQSHFPIGRGNYHVQHEPCWYAVRKGKTAHWSGDRTQSTVWQIDKPMKSETGHSTQKPVECMRRPIENNSKPGEVVYDPFLGSGTTIIAAEQVGRACCGSEVNPAYVDVSVRRWQEFCSGVARLESTGETFDQVANRRRHEAPADVGPLS